MADEKFKPTYVEIYNDMLLAAVETILNPDLLKAQTPTVIAKLDDKKWIVRLDYDFRKG
jgi:hypothetical protein